MEYKLLLKQKLDNMREYKIVYNKIVVGVLSISAMDSNIFIRQIRIFENFQRKGHAKNVIKLLREKYKKDIVFCISTHSKSAVEFWNAILKEYKHKHIRGDIYQILI